MSRGDDRGDERGDERGESRDRPFDLLISGGRIVDGSGAPWYAGDIGISDGVIAWIGPPVEGRPREARRTIEARGRIVAPGFIDMMGQTATPMLDDPQAALNLLRQGVTTINAGEGQSAAPLAEQDAESRGWRTMSEYFQLLDLKGLPLNVVQTVGHTQVRRLVLGEVDRRPSEAELAQMKALVAEGMEAGAIGLSTALIYPPAVYATTQEIAELAKVAAQHGGRYYTHMRNEGDLLLEAIDEALDIGRSAGAAVHIFHLKAAGRQNWPKIDLAIARIRAARAAGQQVTADIYPYVHNGLGIAAFIHPRHFAAGRGALLRQLQAPQLRQQIRREMETEEGWENWYRHVGQDWSKVVIGRAAGKYAELEGQSLAELARACGEDPWDTFFELVRQDAFALPESMNEANKIKLMRQEFISFCTDVGPSGGSRIASHPRGYGAFPRIFDKYVRQLGAISLERAVAQATAAAANDVLALDRGRIAVGLAADLIVFDPETLADRATFAAPAELAVGVDYVIVNGQLVLDQGQLAKNRPGRVLRGPGWRRDQAPDQIRTGQLSSPAAPEAARLQAGVEAADFGSFDRLLQRFLAEHRTPGAALAIARHGRVVYWQGYGYADLAAREPCRADHRFRIASISKPITAAAILQLVERGRLKLEDRVFELLPHRALDGATIDPRLQQITIAQLLEHRGGWDRSKSFDAMFQSRRFAAAAKVAPPAPPAAIIRNMLGVPLDFDPGERYAYSNFGYCLLGRVIEQVTGETYEEYVRRDVLAPLGITGMRIGGSQPHDRQAGEVRYYDPGRGESVFAAADSTLAPAPYGAWDLATMDSHGGWIASPLDLVRFAAAFDDPDNCPILSRDSIARMHQRPPGAAGFDHDGQPLDVYYSLGWSNRVVDAEKGRVSHWHTGSLDGTSTLLVRRYDGWSWSVVFNARVSPTASHLARVIDPLLHQALRDHLENL